MSRKLTSRKIFSMSSRLDRALKLNIISYENNILIMPSFLARKEKTKTKRPVKFKTSDGTVSFKARTKPKRRYRVEF